MEIAVSDDAVQAGPPGDGPEPEAAPAKVRLGPGEEKSDETLESEAMALVFASPEPLSSARLVELLERPAPARVQAALERLRTRLEAAGLPLVLTRVAGAWRLLTDPDSSAVLARLREEPRPERISAAALETLAIVAYRQPVTLPEINFLRGVNSAGVLRTLVDKRLLRVAGRKAVVGTPLLYRTSKEFLVRFGLESLAALPPVEQVVEETGEQSGGA